jgi:hypothetical protein
MNKTAVIAIAIACLATSGCASMTGGHTASWPFSGGVCKEKCDDDDALLVFNKASKFCRDVQNFYEYGGQRVSSAKLAIGSIGTLAGAVIAPVTNGTTATAFSGLSGAANAFQVSLDEAFSASVAVKRRNAVYTAADEGAKAVLSASGEPNKQIQLSIQMAMNCAISSAKADAEALKALSQ